MRTNAASSVKDGRYYLQLAGAEARERLLLAAASLWNVPVAELTAKNSIITHALERPHDELRADRRSRGPDAASAPGDDHDQAAGPVDADGHRAEEPRRARQGHGQDGLRDRRPPARHEVGGGEDVPGLRRRRQELRLRAGPPHAGRALRGPVPDPRSGADARTRLQRRRRGRRRQLVSGQDRARSRCRSSGRFLRSTPRSTARTCARPCSPRWIGPARCAPIRATWTRRFAGAAKIVEATYSTPYLPRARMEPGNATVLVANDRVDIWIGDQSPQETRFSAAKITGIPEDERPPAPVPSRRRVRPQRQRAPGRARHHDRERAPRHADPSCSGPARRTSSAPRIARWAWRGSRPVSMRDGWPIAFEVRTAMQEGGFGPEASFHVTSRYYVPNYRYSNHTTKFHVPVGTRRGVGQAAHEFYRESFIDELARAAGQDPYLYRRELLARTQPALQERHDQGARHGRRDVGLGHAAAAGHGAGDRARGAGRRRQRHGDDQRHGPYRQRQPRKARSGSSASTSRTRPASAWSTRCR